MKHINGRVHLHTFKKKKTPLLSMDCPLIEAIEDWNLYLLQPDDDEWMERFCVLSRTGRPAGGESFIAMIESLLGRVVKPKHLEGQGN